jgi:uncharacterized protein (DUF924 family)
MANDDLDIDPEAILEFWFGSDLDNNASIDARSVSWFLPSLAFDAEISSRFAGLSERGLAGALAHWEAAPRSALALVIALDQFPRNLYRGDLRAFSCDEAALHAAERAIDRGFDREVHPIEAGFFYIPFEHSEDIGAQERCVTLFREMEARCPEGLRGHVRGYIGFAERHRAVIERFGRFPHRNAVLGRRSTDEERAYLQAGGETFGAGSAERR